MKEGHKIMAGWNNDNLWRLDHDPKTIIRCQNCRFSKYNPNHSYRTEYQCMKTIDRWGKVHPSAAIGHGFDWFCADGEPKEEKEVR